MPSKRTNDSVDRILEDLNIQQAQAGLRLLYIQVFQNTVNRIIGTFAWHGDSSL